MKSSILVVVLFLFALGSSMAESYLLEIQGVKKVEQEKTFWEVGWKTTYPQGIFLSLFLCRSTPLASIPLADKGIVVLEREGSLLLGPWEKKLPPGKYKAVLFYAPQLQKNPVSSGFQEKSYDFEIDMTLYDPVFETQRKNVQKILDRIEVLEQILQRDYESAQRLASVAVWRAGQTMRLGLLDACKQEEQKYRSEYVVPFFTFPAREIFPLFHLLEDIEEASLDSLQDAPSRRTDLCAQLRKRFAEAKKNFVYEMLLLAPPGSSAPIEEILSLHASLQARKTLSTPITPTQIRQLAPHFLRLQKWEAARSSLSWERSIPEVFLTVQNLLLERRETKGDASILYDLMQTLLEDILEKKHHPAFEEKNFPKAPLRWEEQWEKLRSQAVSLQTDREILSQDLKEMKERQNFLLRFFTLKPRTPLDPEMGENAMTEILERQQQNKAFCALFESPSRGRLFYAADEVYLHLIHLYQLSLEEGWDGGEPEEIPPLPLLDKAIKNFENSLKK